MRTRPFVRRAIVLATLAAALVGVTGSGTPAGAATASSGGGGSASSDDGGSPDGGAPTQPRIIGGEVAPPGSWPQVVGVYWREGRYEYLNCSGTVISPTWVLTAAHCLPEVQLGPVPTDEWWPQIELIVRAGSQSTTSGGQRVRVISYAVRNDARPYERVNDVALLQLEKPVAVAQPLQVGSPTDIPTPGAPLRTAGWGLTEDQRDFPSQLRQVSLPAVSGADCQTWVNEAAASTGTPRYHSSQLCAGPIGTGDVGTCYGDDGAPLVWEVEGRKVIVGVASWMDSCASPEVPSVFAKVASASRWIAQTIQYGPHFGAEDFGWSVSEDYRDPRLFSEDDGDWNFRPPTGEPGAVIAALHKKPWVAGRDAAIVRLYDAVLDRPAEANGYSYWRDNMLWNRYNLTRVAEVMARSQEFKTTYGSLGNTAFVEQLYQNVLGRAGAPGDVAYWAGRLNGGESRGRIVLLISESAENKARTQGVVDVQVAFLNLIRRAPQPYEVDAWKARPVAELGRSLVQSMAYARLHRSYWEYGTTASSAG